MRLATFGLFVLILGTGAVVETAYQVRERLPGQRIHWGFFRGRFDGPSHSFDQAARTFPLTAGTAVEVGNEHGNVKVLPGTAPEVKVTLRTVVYDEDAAVAASLARQVLVLTETTPNGFRITTNRDQVESSQPGPRQSGIETHLEIQVPPGTPARVRNDHGDASVWDVASLDLENAFGTVDVQRVGADARVANRHGDSRVADVKGALTLEVRNGDAQAERTTGAVRGEHEHGTLRVVESGAVTLRTNHVELELEKVGGDLQVDGEHTAVTAAGVAGKAVVRTGYRDVELKDVTSDVTVESQHGGIRLARLGGTAKVSTRHDNVDLADVKGLVDVEVENGEVKGTNLAGGATVRARHDAVRIDGFSGPVQVIGEQTSVDLATSTAPTQPISVRTTHDSVRVAVPAGSALEVDARASHGEVDVDLPGFTPSSQEPHHVAGRVGTAGPRLSLDAENGSVKIETNVAVQR